MTGSIFHKREASGYFCVVGRAWIAKYMYKGVEGFSATLFGPKVCSGGGGLLGQAHSATDRQ